MNIETARDYYGKVLTGSDDLRTDACCTVEARAPHVERALANVHPEVRARYYGCGLVVPQAIEGARVLDLGSGSGQDAFLLAQLVGPTGSVTGIDATAEQLEIARSYRQWHADRFGFANVDFVEGDIARLDQLGLAEGGFDVIVSNCVINLVADKAAAFRAAHSLLKPGGEVYFADVYADRRVPAELLSDPVLYGECLAGALYRRDFEHLATAAGFADPRLVTERSLAIGDEAVARKVDGIGFTSATYRLFRLAELDPGHEDYGLAARYRGTISECPDRFVLDADHAFPVGELVPVSGNTWLMLSKSRLAAHFELAGDRTRHLGPFDASASASSMGSSCC